MSRPISHRVTRDHVAFCASAPAQADGRRRASLVDTDQGIALVTPDQVLAGGGVRRLLLTRTELVESAQAAGLSVSEYVRRHGGRLAADLNKLISEG